MTNTGKLVAILFHSPNPLDRQKLCEIMQIKPSELGQLVKETNETLAPTGLIVVDNKSLLLVTQSDYANLIESFYQVAPQQLSQAALEVLSVIAYHQPISKIKIDEMRGVSSEQSIKNLLNKQLIEKSSINNQITYHTTTEFLKTIGINSLKELPLLDVQKA